MLVIVEVTVIVLVSSGELAVTRDNSIRMQSTMTSGLLVKVM